MTNRIFYTKPSITELEVGYAEDAARTGWGAQCYDYIHKFGGQYLTRGGAMETLEGENETLRVVVLSFPDMDSARACYNSPEYTKARDARSAAATAQFIILDGYTPAE